MFGFLKDVGSNLMQDAMQGNQNQQQGGQGQGQQQYGGGQPQQPQQPQYGGQGQYGGGQGQYGGGQPQQPQQQQQGGGGDMAGMAAGLIGGFLGGGGNSQGGQSGYGPPPGQGPYGPPQGQYGPGPNGPPKGQYGPPPQQGGGGSDFGGMAANIIGGFLGGGGQQPQQPQPQQQQQGGGGMNDIISGMAGQYISGMMTGGGNNQYGGSGGSGDFIGSMTQSVMGNILSGDGGQDTMQKTGLNGILVSGIMANVMNSVSGHNAPQSPDGGNAGVSGDLMSSVTSSVIKEIASQDTDGKILRGNDGNANSAIISHIATNVLKNVVSQGGQGGGGGGNFQQQLVAGMASQYIGNLISGGGQQQQSGGGGGGGKRDVLSGITSSLMGSGGNQTGSSNYQGAGGSIASNIIGKVVRNHQFSTKEDGEVVENLSQMHVEDTKNRIFPGPSSLISSFLNKGAYHLRNRLRRGGGGGGQAPAVEGDINPANAVFNFGERGSGLRARGKVQDFYSLRQQCQDDGSLYEDPDFPALDSSIFFSRSPPKPFEWKRPHEVVDDPKLFIEGASRFDVKQGELGDCWLLAAIANLTLSKRLFYQIVPSDQGFGDNYAGIFHFRFWQYGRWVDVVIDDRLPTFYGKLVFMHSDEKNEFWSALLEKAYAKLHGSYEALKGGTTCEAMEDFTGGVSEIYDLAKAPPNLFNIMLKAYQRGSLMGCSLEPDPNVTEARCDDGLIRGHAYSITRVKYVEIQTPRVSGKIPLVRIRNPWGNEAEWVGAWSDKSPEWEYIPEDEKEEIGLNFEHDGEFWMSFKDFSKKFGMVEMTNLNPDSIEDSDMTSGVTHKWEMSVFEGAWIRGSTAGGCRNFLETFWHNPQYRITLTEVDDDDDDNKCTVIVALMQKNRRSQRKLGLECLTIGFAIYHLRDPENTPRPVDLNFFKYNASVARSPSFINMREVSCRFKLPPGTYCIVPSTFETNDEGEFILRIFSEKSNDMEENDEEVGFGQVDERDEERARGPSRSNIVVKPEEDEEQAVEADERVRNFFAKVAGEDLEVDWKELQDVLNFALKREFEFDGFTKDVCRSMIAMIDVDRSGKLGLQEFIGLWKDIRLWKNAFRLYDKDGSGCLCGFELRQALNSAGYRLNNHITDALMLRYGDSDGKVSFDDFIMCSVKLKTMMAIEDPDERDAVINQLLEEHEEQQEEQEDEE